MPASVIQKRTYCHAPPLLSDTATLNAIGHTPVVRFRHVVPKSHAGVLVKLEYFNPTSSYKDRVAKSMIEETERRGDLKPDMVVEVSIGLVPPLLDHE